MSDTRNRGSVLCALLLAAALSTASASAAQQALPDLSLEELMRMNAGRVFGASERMQPVTEAPASVSFITADDIARQGYRTLADILRGVRGLYVTDDRTFSMVGARGFGRPGDYNSRILLLVNGHRVNDNVFGQAEIGAEFGLDATMFERVEIIRGPASALYGDSAFFAVVNVITRSGASIDGVSLTVDGGTLGTRLARGTAGRRFKNGVDAALSGSFDATNGVSRLYFPAFDTPETNRGIAEGLDGEAVRQFYGRLQFRDLTITGAYGHRRRDVPTASFGTIFNEQQFREQTTDRHTLLDADYARSLAKARISVRLSYDRFFYNGQYRTIEPAAVTSQRVLGTRWTIGARVTRELPGHQVMTVGAEFIDNLHQDQVVEYSDGTSGLDAPRSSTQQALYAQDEIKPARWLIVNGGLRYDSYDDFTRITPRAALIVLPSSNQSFKYLYGRAFRAPNGYERTAFLFGERVNQLRPESIDTHELVWERYTHDWLRTSVSSYWYNADRLITLIADLSTNLDTTFVNEGHVRAGGLEVEAQMRLARGIQGVVSYAVQQAQDVVTHATLANSPRQMGKVRVSIPGPRAGSFFSTEVLLIGDRKTLAGNMVGAALTANATIIQPLGRAFDLVGTVRNLFDRDYSDPVSDQHLQDSIQQNGRTFRLGVTWKLWQGPGLTR